MVEYKDKVVVELLNDPEQANHAAEIIFKKYYPYVFQVVNRMVTDRSKAEDIAQDVFLDIWRKRDHLKINTSLKGYLKRAGINKSLNYFRDNKFRFENSESIEVKNISVQSHQSDVEVQDLQRIVDLAIEGLPERCRIIFKISRFEGLSYNEISERLGISVKTVENQISKALRILREAVKNYK